MSNRFTMGSGSNQHLEHVQTVDVSEQWVTHLTWLPWASMGENERELHSHLGNCFRFIPYFEQASLCSFTVLLMVP
jgi:hypothetical protein